MLKFSAKNHLFCKRLAVLSRPCWPHLCAIAALSLLSTPLSLLAPLPLKIAVDGVLGHDALPSWLSTILPVSAARHPGTVVVAAGLLLGIAVLVSLQSLAAWLLQTYTGEKLVLDFRSQLLWHAQRLSLGFHDRRGYIDTAYRIQHDAPAVQNILVQGILPMVTAVFSFLAMLYVTTRINWQLAAIALLLSPLLYLLARNSSRKVRTGYDGLKELDSSAMLVLHEALSSVRAVKAFGQEQFEDNLFRRKSRLRMSEQVHLASIQASFHVFIGLTIALGTAAALLVGVKQVQAGRISVGELFMVMAYMAQLYEPLRTISAKIPELQGAIASVQRAFSLLDEVPELGENTSVTTTRPIRGDVSFENVSFQYGENRRVLHDISFYIPAGCRVGIVGPSGSGKSTLINLLTRFYDPACGRIRLDGIDLRNFRIADLRNQFSIVMQEPMLFSTSIAGNIAYARPDASRAQIVDAAKSANADKFISRLPQGYDTQIGDNGLRLSGGERQRIAIARAFLKNAPLLILDEPTSAIDIKTEAAIMDAIDNLVVGRTTFMIAHRLSTVRRCDMILILKEGRLILQTSDFNQVVEQMGSKPPSNDPLLSGFPSGSKLVQ
ncbi:MAG TPA: ABC transporter ATP-binding protein [Clostridia bacterium]|nr:ABC transporter ATP-binding protein [Clostridia bacterium]